MVAGRGPAGQRRRLTGRCGCGRRRTGRLLHTLTGHTGAVWAVGWSPDGARLVSGGDDGTVRVWEAASGRLLHTLTGHTGGVRAVGWSPDGTRLVSGGADGRLVVWSLHTLKPELYLQLEKLAAVSWAGAGIAVGGVNGVAVFDLRITHRKGVRSCPVGSYPDVQNPETVDQGDTPDQDCPKPVSGTRRAATDCQGFPRRSRAFGSGPGGCRPRGSRSTLPISPDASPPAEQRSPGHRRGPPRGSYAATSGPPNALKCRNGKARCRIRTEPLDTAAAPTGGLGSEAGRAVTITAWWILPGGRAELDAVEQLIGRRVLRSEPCGRAGA